MGKGTIMNTKARISAKNWSRDSNRLEFDTSRLQQSTVAGTQPLGAASIEQSQKGFFQSSVQGALEDIIHLYQHDINDIIIRDSEADPAGDGMIERLTITGTATDTPVFVYGFPVKLNPGDNQATITQRIYDRLQIEQGEGRYFKMVAKVSGVDNELDIKFLDTRPHDNFNEVYDQVVINGSTQQEAVPGYGTWTRIGEQEIDNGSGQKTKMVYFKRIS